MCRLLATLALLLTALPALALAAGDESLTDLRARIDSLRIAGSYAAATATADTLIVALQNDPGSKSVDPFDAERLRDHLLEIAELSADAQNDLARADAMEASINSLAGEARFDEAISITRQQLEIRREHLGAANVDAIQSLAYVAALLYYTGDYTGATESWYQQLQLKKTLYGDEHLEVAAALGDYSLGLQEIGELDHAQRVLSQSIAMRRRLEAGPKSMAAALNNLGTLLYSRGDLAACEPLMREALRLLRYRSDVEAKRVTTAMGNLAVVLNKQGNHDAAAALYVEAISYHLEQLPADHPDLAALKSNLASARQEQGRLADAEVLAREALWIRRETLGEDHDDVANSLDRLAEILDELDQRGEAETLYREALAVRRRTRTQGSFAIASTLQSLGVFLHRGDQLESAEECLREALSIRTAVFGDDHSGRAESLHALARIRRDRGDLVEARQLLTEACRVHEVVRGQAGSGIERAISLASPWSDMAALHLMAAQPEAAWSAVERSSARSLSDLLREAEARELSDAERSAEAMLRDRLAKLRDELTLLFEADGDAPELRPLEQVREELLVAESDWSAMQQDLAAKYPVSEGVIVPLDRVRRALPPTTAMVGWLDIEIEGVSQAAAWVIRADQPVTWSTPVDVAIDSDEIRSSLRALHDEDSARAVLRSAYDERFGAIMAELEGVEDLIVVPSPAMVGVPVDALLDDEGRFLGESFTVSYEPSATLYTWTQERAIGDSSGNRRALLVGNPPYRSDGQLAAVAQVSTELYRSASRGNRDALDRLPPLPGTEAEVRALQHIFPDHTVLLGKDASEQRLAALADSELAGYRVLHFATHGIPDDRRPDLSALVLSQVGLPDPLESVLAGDPIYDGILTAGEIVENWKLDAELVTLSACETALGTKVAGEGYVGLAYAFYQAGARSQLVGLWQVEDLATALLMQRFYENWIARTMSKATALAEAKQWLRKLSFDQAEAARKRLNTSTGTSRNASLATARAVEWFDEGPYAHPFFWAPFVLLGDPR